MLQCNSACPRSNVYKIVFCLAISLLGRADVLSASLFHHHFQGRYAAFTEGSSYVQAVAIDSAGNRIVAVTFDGRVDADITGKDSIIDGGPDQGLFIAKYGRDGDLKFIIPLLQGMELDEMLIDPKGDIIVTGSSINLPDLDPSEANNNGIIEGKKYLNRTSFVIKYSNSGNLIFAYRNPGSSFVCDIALDDGGNVILLYSTIESTLLAIGAGPGIRIGTDSTADLHLLRLDQSGAIDKIVSLTGDAGRLPRNTSIISDNRGGYYIWGQTQTLSGANRMVIAHLDSQFQEIWSNSFMNEADLFLMDIIADVNGNVWLSIYSPHFEDLDPGKKITLGKKEQNCDGYFVGYYGSSGALISCWNHEVDKSWIYTMIGKSNGNIAVIGLYEDAADFSAERHSDTLQLHAPYKQGLFISEYDSTGKFLRVNPIQDTCFRRIHETMDYRIAGATWTSAGSFLFFGTSINQPLEKSQWQGDHIPTSRTFAGFISEVDASLRITDKAWFTTAGSAE